MAKRKRRNFTPEFKTEVVLEALTGGSSQAELCRRHTLSDEQLSNRIESSVARRGCPWENGYAERLIRTLKEEEVHLNDYEDIHEAKARIGHFIT